MAKGKVSLPSGSGGIVRYFDQPTSKIEFSAQTLVIVCIAIIILFTAIHLMIGGFF